MYLFHVVKETFFFHLVKEREFVQMPNVYLAEIIHQKLNMWWDKFNSLL